MSHEPTRAIFRPEDGLRRPRLLVLACAIGLAFSVGPMFISSFSTFIPPLEQEFGWSRGALSMFFTTAQLALVVTTYFLGPLVARFGSRRVIVISAVAMAGSLLGLALTPPVYWVLIFWCAMIGATGAGTNTFSYLAVLPQWFNYRLGLLFGLAMTGIGLGQLTMPMVAQQVTAAAGWRASYAVLAGLVLCISAPVAHFLLKENPKFARKPDLADTDALPGYTLSEAQSTPTFRLLWISFFLLSFLATGAVVHLAPLLIDRGVPPKTAASLVGLTGLSVLIFRLAGGYFLDRVGPLAIGTLAFVAGGLAQLSLLPQMGTSLIVAAPLLYGLVVGLEGDVLPYISRRFFGLKAYALIYNRMFLSMMAGGVPGAVVIGYLYDFTGGYTVGLWCMATLAVVSMGLFWLGIHLRPQRSKTLSDMPLSEARAAEAH